VPGAVAELVAEPGKILFQVVELVGNEESRVASRLIFKESVTIFTHSAVSVTFPETVPVAG
jgi:hypothetical protein